MMQVVLLYKKVAELWWRWRKSRGESLKLVTNGRAGKAAKSEEQVGG
jgi:hypothetical protein